MNSNVLIITKKKVSQEEKKRKRQEQQEREAKKRKIKKNKELIEKIEKKKADKQKKIELIESIKNRQLNNVVLQSSSTLGKKIRNKLKLEERLILKAKEERDKPKQSQLEEESEEEIEKEVIKPITHEEIVDEQNKVKEETSVFGKIRPCLPELPDEILPPINPSLENISPELLKPFNVSITRKPEIIESRSKLPVCQMEQEIIEAILYNPVVIICGETGSGKTTQIPQFLYERGFGNKDSPFPGQIGITQPRRVAAISMAFRVAEELNIGIGKDKEISYQIRYDTKTVGENNIIKFMTDGILLKEIQSDFLLRKYSCIIIDEAHERTINIDLLIGFLSRIVKLRNEMVKTDKSITPLRLIIMSATLRVNDFKGKHLFETEPPVIEVQSRQYKVSEHFARRTVLDNYLEPCNKLVRKIHERLPKGGILVFLTGKQEIISFCNQLEEYNDEIDKKNTKEEEEKEEEKEEEEGNDDVENNGNGIEIESEDDSASESESDVENNENDELSDDDITNCPNDKDDYVSDSEELFSDSEFVIDDDEEEEEGEEKEKEGKGKEEEKENEEDNAQKKENEKSTEEKTEKNDGDDKKEKEEEEVLEKLYILPLYALLSDSEQHKIFTPPPDNTRLVVVSTNVAETSLTIPGIKYVVDCGRVKERVYDYQGSSRFEIHWISKASAKQRLGRAGRVGPGHCYRLYSSPVYVNYFQEFSSPEITSKPLEDVILQIRSLGIPSNIQFPFPSLPSTKLMNFSENLLKNIGALNSDSVITDLGKNILKYPIGCRLGKMLVLSIETDVLIYILCIIAGYSVRNPINIDEIDRKSYTTHVSDDVILLLFVINFMNSNHSQKYCKDHGLRYQAMIEVSKLIRQLSTLLHINDKFPKKLSVPTAEQQKLILKIVGGAYVDNLVRKMTTEECRQYNAQHNDKKWPYIRGIGNKEPLYVHPQSFLHFSSTTEFPQYLIYKELFASKDKVYMKGVSVIEENWIFPLSYGTPLCNLSEPLETPPPYYSKSEDRILCKSIPSFNGIWELPPANIEYPNDNKNNKKYLYFAKYLLDGNVVYPFKLLHPYIRETSLITRLTANNVINNYTRHFINSKIDTKEKLLKMWMKDRTFLKNEVYKWISTSKYRSFNDIWDIIVKDYDEQQTEEFMKNLKM